jgi:uncharacterized protein DUF4386
MSTSIVMKRTAEESPRLKARTAGALYLIIIVVASFAEFFVHGQLAVGSDAAATAANILAREPLYRLGGAAVLIYLACDTAVALIFYELFKPVSRSFALLAAFFRLLMVTILGVNLLNHFAPLVLLKGSHLTAFTTDQLQALALVSLRMYAQGFNIALVFFGFHCVLIGSLIFRSTFLPRVIGVLLAITGVLYLTNSFANFLAPEFGALLFRYLLPFGLPGELSLTLWLLVVGVNVQRWNELASSSAFE